MRYDAPLVAGRFPTAAEANAIAARSREAREHHDFCIAYRERTKRAFAPNVLSVASLDPELAAIRDARAAAFDEAMRMKGATGAREWAVEALALLDVENRLLRERKKRG